MDRLALAITEHLEFDVPRIRDIFLHVAVAVAKGRASLGRGLAHQALELVFRLDHFHAAPAAARRRLDQHRIADFGGDLPRLRGTGDRAVRAGDQRQAELGRRALGFDLVAHGPDVLGLGADPDDVVAFYDLGEL